MLAILVLTAIPVFAGGRPLTANLLGSNEVPGPGDQDGSGSAYVTLNQGLGEVCWEISFEGIAEPFAAHIHFGDALVSGGVAVPLNTSSGCIDGVDADLIKDIRQHPENYYVNVHNADFPPGALRGQLSK
jgi:hypothetical protein